MYTHPQRRSSDLTQKLRNRAGVWLRELREKRNLSQRDLAAKVGAEYYTFISQLENGRGRIPPDRYLVWAHALGMDKREFVRVLMSFYDPVTYGILFDDADKPAAQEQVADNVTPLEPLQLKKAARSRSLLPTGPRRSLK